MAAGRDSAARDRHFREVQRFGVWAGLPVLATIPIWWGFIQQVVLGRPSGLGPAPDWIWWLLIFLVGILVPVLLLSTRLIVEVRPEELYIRYVPLRTRRIPWRSIRSCAPRTYRPIREYGGWGLRYGWSRGWVYSVSGREGVQLEIEGERPLLIGSRRAEELARAIQARLPHPKSGHPRSLERQAD